MTVPNFSPPAAPLTGNTLTHVVIQPPHATGGDYYGDGTLTVSPYVKGRYTCTSELLANNDVAAPWTLESANWGQLPFNGSNVALLGDIADVATSVGAPVVSRARAQALASYHLPLQSKWEISRDSGATWTLYKLGAERVGDRHLLLQQRGRGPGGRTVDYRRGPARLRRHGQRRTAALLGVCLRRFVAIGPIRRR